MKIVKDNEVGVYFIFTSKQSEHLLDLIDKYHPLSIENNFKTKFDRNIFLSYYILNNAYKEGDGIIRLYLPEMLSLISILHHLIFVEDAFKKTDREYYCKIIKDYYKNTDEKIEI